MKSYYFRFTSAKSKVELNLRRKWQALRFVKFVVRLELTNNLIMHLLIYLSMKANS